MGTRGQFLADRQQCGAEEPPGPGLDTGEWSHGHQRQPQADLKIVKFINVTNYVIRSIKVGWERGKLV